MMRFVSAMICCMMILFLSGCKPSNQASDAVAATPTSMIDSNIHSPQPTLETQLSFLVPNVTEDDVIAYFNEVCLDAEFIHSGNPNNVQKWVTPIYYTLYGAYTAEDLTVFSAFVDWVNTIDGFPGMFPADDPYGTNLRIHFCDQQELIRLMGDSYYGLDGAVTFWYENDEIYDAIICYRSDINQYTRNSVILEELYNALGPIQDTDLRADSVIYSGFSEPQSLTDVDELLLKLLYHPNIRCGMNASECEEVIRALYN